MRNLLLLLIVTAFGLASTSLHAAPAASRLPVFGTEGAEFATKAQGDHSVHGWLPKDWSDNTEWAAVSAKYSKLTDAPAPKVGAVRIKIDKVEEGQLQLTTYQGERKYLQGKTYKVTGWVRSPDRVGLKIGVRQIEEPFEMYHEDNVSTQTEWKPFEFEFKPSSDFEAFLMFIVNEAGTIDLAGVAVAEAK